jgi:hypothetical protein
MTDKSVPAEAPAWGPAMAALANDRQRAFVQALFHPDAPAKGDGLGLFAAHRAGYGNSAGTTTDKAMGVIAARLGASPAIQNAIREYFGSVIHSLAPDVARELRFKLNDRNDRDQVKALAMVADRLAPIEQSLTVAVKFEPPTIEQTEAVLQKIHELARRAGLPAPPPPVIDAEYVEVTGE